MNDMPILNLDAHYYCQDETFDLERQRLFAKTWQYLGPASQVEKSGQYVCHSIAGISVIVLRGMDGILRGFLNQCRHRGSPLLEQGHGRCARRLRCPYHLWTYELSGELVDTPWYGNTAGFDPKDWSLKSIQVDEWRGLLFAAIESEKTLIQQLGAAVEELEDVPMQDFYFGGDASLEFSANWKIYTDNFVEGYHIPGIHPEFYAQIDFDQFTTQALDGVVSMRAPTGKDLFYQGRWYWLWPNWTLSLYPNGMSTSRISPTAAGHTVLHYYFFFSDCSSETEDERQQVIDRNLAVIREDFEICIGVHKNYRSGYSTPGPLSTRHESGVAWFQQRWRETVLDR